MKNIAEYEGELTELLFQKLKEIPEVHILGSKSFRGSLVSFSVKGLHPLDVATLLDLQGIAVRSGHLCAQPIMRHYGLAAALRASIAFYNSKEEINHFIEILKKVIARLS
jgi:cysteine desulfurase/selenocysteine lyase